MLKPIVRLGGGMVYFLIVGLLAGWLAGLILKGRGFGLIGNLLLGVVGAFLGGLMFQFLGLSSDGFIGSLITATVGAIVILVVAGRLKRG
ncbi:GlsB/YeaQ/YmgE family stress response membrane protein [Candidatus Endoriftia persephonae]|jgi:uncharacterized membrane protein YeaQ/YmgE (transglycosylase-associated protein family)|uniref:Transglycosylase-associated protein n=2 Tax=Gammaproteobacteria TaxID=1236 RepID=G2FEJ5_9GAMM|nr:GlsB/YeaQ/YmgE family stress response membrane protein [Candidatus Endoriftia persephone]EGW54764.1 transglycosylase-associated protein [endosymbiont of Tevnia jerichonana (vent Tica)]